MSEVINELWADKRLRRTIIIFGVLGFLLRMIFIPFTMHNDILHTHMFASKLAYQGIYDIYGYIKVNFYETLAGKGLNYYPPLTYFLLGSFYVVVKPITSGFGNWMETVTQMSMLGDRQNYLELFSIPFNQLGYYISLMKVPYLLFDLLCAFVIMLYFKNAQESVRAFKLWMINPVVIFGSYIFGQFDIMLAFFLLLSLLLIAKRRLNIGMLIIGCSTLLKPSSLVLILPMSLLLGVNLKQAMKLMLISVAPILLVMLPFYISTGNYVLSAMFPIFVVKSGASIIDTIEFTIGKMIFITCYGLLVCRLVFWKKARYNLSFDGWKYILCVMLLSYFIFYSPVHYFQWVIPLLIIGIVNGNIPRKIYVFQIVCLFLYALNSRELCWQLLLPVDPEYFYNLRGLPEFMNQFLKWGVVMRLARLLFYGCSFFIIWKTMFKPEIPEVADV